MSAVCLKVDVMLRLLLFVNSQQAFSSSLFIRSCRCKFIFVAGSNMSYMGNILYCLCTCYSYCAFDHILKYMSVEMRRDVCKHAGVVVIFLQFIKKT